jgi:hypothetical protein
MNYVYTLRSFYSDHNININMTYRFMFDYRTKRRLASYKISLKSDMSLYKNVIEEEK